MTDKERINWLGKQFGCALINDDNGHWAVVSDGFQNVVTGKKGRDVQTTFFIEAGDWENSVRRAIDAKIKDRS